MRAQWQLAINSLAGRPSRTILLTVAVTLAATLSVVVACAIGTLQESYKQSIAHVAGSADVQIRHRARKLIDAELLDKVRQWPGVELAVGRLDQQGVTLRPAEKTPAGGDTERDGSETIDGINDEKSISADIAGIEPKLDAEFFPVRIDVGRDVEQAGEIVVDQRIATELDVALGDQILISRGKFNLKVVGITRQPPLSVLQLPGARVVLQDVEKVVGVSGFLRGIQIRLTQDAARNDAALFVAAHEGELPKTAVLEPPAAARAGINRAVKWTNLMGGVATMLVALSTVFLIVTGLTTAVTERTCELATFRCVGASRTQLAIAQVAAGMTIAGVGAIVGTPLGLLIARLIYQQNDAILVSGFVAPVRGVGFAVLAVLGAGLVGGIYPAWAAARVQPLQALASRAVQPRRAGIVLCLVLGVVCVLFQPVVLLVSQGVEQAFWVYLPVGLTITFLGYCLLCVPLLVVLLRPLCAGISWSFRLPRSLLRQTIASTPYRHGLTAGALMIGLAILVTIWAEGGNLLYGWFDQIKMPDAFMYANPADSGGDKDKNGDGTQSVITQITTAFQTRAFPPKAMEMIRQHPDVTAACGIIARRVLLTDVQFGVKGMSPPFTIFAASDVESFLRMTQVEWVEGDPAVALSRLRKGNAVLVGREFKVAQGLGVGAKLKLLTWNEGEVEFEIVGVIGATGLDVAVAHYGIGQTYAEASIGTVFGTLEDGKKYWGSGTNNTGRFKMDDPELLLLDFKPGADQDRVLKELKEQCEPIVGGDIRSDTSNSIREMVHRMSVQLMAVASAIAIASLLISCFGVANLIVAEVQARQFEFGVLRAIGGDRSMLGKLIAGQTLVIALVACVTGAALGIQLAAIAKVFHARLVGMTYHWQMPWGVLGFGSAVVIVMALGAAGPTMWRLMRKKPTALLVADAR